jgi:hypothetical protein
VDHFGGRVAPIRTTKRASVASEEHDAWTMHPTEPAQHQAKLASLDAVKSRASIIIVPPEFTDALS